jgi:hypothetical protein
LIQNDWPLENGLKGEHEKFEERMGSVYSYMGRQQRKLISNVLLEETHVLEGIGRKVLDFTSFQFL